AVSHVDSVEGLGEGTDLVHLNQDGVGSILSDALLQALRVGDEEVVANDLNLIADGCGEVGVTLPVIFLQWVLDGDDWVRVNELSVNVCHLSCGVLATFEVVGAVLEELRGSNVQSKSDVLAWGEASLLDCLND